MHTLPRLAATDTTWSDYPSIHDQAGGILLLFRKLGPQSPPTTLLIDREGRIAGRFIQAVTEIELLGPVQVLARER